MELLTVVRSTPTVSLVEPCSECPRLLCAPLFAHCPDSSLCADTHKSETIQVCDAIVFTCAHDYCMKMGGGIPVSEVFDLGWAMAGTPDRPLPLMHSYGDFRTMLSRSGAPVTNVTSDICIDTRSQLFSKCAGAVAGMLMVDVKFTQIGWGEKTIVSDLVESRLALHPEHYRTVGGVLAASNVTGPFSLVHWRGERQGIDFNSCAEKIVRTKERLVALKDSGDLGDYSTPDSKFILMSSVKDDKDSMWWAAQVWRDKFSSETNNPGTALDIIRSAGFVTFDGLLRDSGIKPRDAGLLAVYDLILVGLADQFSTCARGCRTGQCHSCNHMGKFSKMTLDMRPKDKEESTYACWPI